MYIQSNPAVVAVENYKHKIGNAKISSLSDFLSNLSKRKNLVKRPFTLLMNPNQQKGLFTKFFLFDKFDGKSDNEEIFAFPILLFHRFQFYVCNFARALFTL